MLPSPRRSNSRFLVSRGSLLGLLALTAYLAFVSIALAAAPPVNTVAPTITGDTEVGSTLSATTGTWTGDPTPTYGYQWQRCEQTTPLVTTPFNTSNLGGQTYVDPRDITIDSSGNLYVTNTFTGSVSKVAPDGTTNGTWGTAIAGSQPFAIDVDPSGNVYLANRGNGTVRKISSGGGAGSTLFSLTTAQAVTVDSSGNVYAGSSDGTIVKYDSGGNLVWSKSAGAAVNDVVTDSSGNLYALKNSGIAKVAADGTLTASWATTGGQPQEFAIDSSGNLYTANYSSNNITKTTPAGGASTVFGTTGTNPRDVVVDNTTGAVYVINAGANTTTKINAAGESTTPYSTTGSFPVGITRNSSGDLYTVNYSSSNVTGVGPDLSCNDISGADDPTYTLTGDDKNKKIRVKVTGTNGSGSSDSASAPTSLVTAPPVNTVAPTITGDTEVGSTLSATTGTWTGDPTITYGYQWQRCEGSGTDLGVDWLALNSSQTATGRWRAVAWGGPDGDKKFVAVANTNATGSPFAAEQLVITSPDGVTWTRQTALEGNWWDVAWGDPAGATPGQFVAVARSASGNQIMTSPDGINWAARTAPNSNQWTSVTWGNNQFVAVALSSAGGQQVMTSPDGITWTGQDAASTNTWISVTYGGPSGQEKFVAVGASGSNPNYTAQIMTSPDGATWTSRSSSFATITESVEWGNGKFVASGSFNSVVLTSSDGITWANAGATGYSPGVMGFGGPPGEEEFLAIGFSFSGTATTTMTSSDGVTWTEHPDALPKDVWYGPFWGGPAGEEKWIAPGLSLYDNTKPIAISPGLICTDISGADDPTYQLTGGDKDKKIRVKVTGTNGSGSSSANSSLTSTVTATAPANTVAPSISGTPEVGQTLTGDSGTWTGAPTPDLTYQWQRCDADGTNCVDISGADGLSYEVTSDDTGKTIKFKVTGTNTEGSADASSDPTEVVPTPPTPSKPSVKPAGGAGANSMRLNIRCAGASACTVKITGKLKGGKGTVEPKTIRVKAGKKTTVKVAYTPALTSELKRKGGGRIVLTAKQVGGATRTLTVKVALPKPVTG